MNLPNIAKAVMEKKQEKIRLWPIHSNRASEAGHPCIRYLTYLRTRWQDRAPHSVGLELIFERGRVVEEAALREIQEAGFTVLEQQRPYTWPKLQLTGHIDGKIMVKNKTFPIEIKTINPYDFEKINSVEDLLSSEKYWLKKYPAQLTLYMLLSEEETALLYLKNALTWQPKSIWITLDYDYADELVKKIEAVNKHVQENTVPDGINDADICPDCPFFHICLPSLKGEELPIQDDQELIAILEEWESLKPAYTRYQQLDAVLKQRLEGVEKLMVGDWLITGRWLERKGYTVEPGRYWQRKIRRIGGEK